jgi:hypothetical protein
MLKHVGGFSIFESYNLPIKLRNWFVLRLDQQLQMEREEMEKAQSSPASRR